MTLGDMLKAKKKKKESVTCYLHGQKWTIYEMNEKNKIK